MNRRSVGGRLAAILGVLAVAMAVAAPVAMAEVALEPAAVPVGCSLVGDIQVDSTGGTTLVNLPAGTNFALLRYENEYDYGEAVDATFRATSGGLDLRQTIVPVAGGTVFRIPAPGEYRVTVPAYRIGPPLVRQTLDGEIFACQRALDTDPTPAAEPLEGGLIGTSAGTGTRTIPLDFTGAAYVRFSYDTRSAENSPLTLLLRNPERAGDEPIRVFNLLRADGYVDIPVSVDGGPGAGSRFDGYTLEIRSSVLNSSVVEVSKLNETGEFDGDFGTFAPPSALGCVRALSGAGAVEGPFGQTFTLTGAEAQKDTILAVSNFLGPSPTTVFLRDEEGDVVYTEDFGIGEDQLRRLDLDAGTYSFVDANGIGHASSIRTYIACDPAPPANEPPDAVDDDSTTGAGESVRIGVLTNDTDPDGDRLTPSVLRAPGDGTARVNGDGTLTYTPDRGFSGTDTFTYRVSDGNGGTDEATVSVRVTPAPVPPPPPDRPDRCERGDRGGTVGKAKAGSAVAKGDTRGDRTKASAKTQNTGAVATTSCKGKPTAKAGDIRIKGGKIKGL